MLQMFSKTVEANASFNTNNERWQQTLREQCRNFFLHAPKAAIADVCEGIGYSENEGCEDCFYERQGQKYGERYGGLSVASERTQEETGRCAAARCSI